MMDRPALASRLSRKDWTLVVLGLAVWVALGCGGAWLVHQMRQPKASCGGDTPAQTSQAHGPTAPGNSFDVLTGQRGCQ